MVLLLEAAGGRVPDGVLPHIEKSMNLLLQKSGSDIGAVVSSDEFLALLDLFHGDRKTAFCKSFLKVRWMKTGYCSVRTHWLVVVTVLLLAHPMARLQTFVEVGKATGDAVVIHSYVFPTVRGC